MRRTKILSLTVSALIFSVAAAAAIANAFAGQTTRVSVSSTGDPANGSVSSGVLSADGRYVVFTSNAGNLTGVIGQHVYRHDRATGDTVLVDLATTGGPSAGPSLQPTLSADGRHVAFATFASDLVAGDTNGRQDVFVRDMESGTTMMVSSSADGVPGNDHSSLSGLSGAHEISDDGRYVIFVSLATNLVAEPNNGRQQVYVKDTQTGTIVRASVNDAGVAGDNNSSTPSISGNGQVVAFRSEATNLALSSSSQVFVRDLVTGVTTLESPGAAAVARPSTVPVLSFDGRYLAFVSDAALDPRDLDNGTSDVYLRDRAAGTTVLVSLSPNTVAGAISGSPSISGDGRWVAFNSLDEQIVAGDLNSTTDVFLYDRDSEAVILVSLNDAGDQANGPSSGASVSFDGSLVLFASSASNLVASPSSTTAQLYVRSLASNVAPSVDLPSTVDLAFSLTLDMSGTFTDPGSASGETYSATVDYGDGTGTQALALDGGTFGLFHTYAAAGAYTVTVVVTDSGGASGSATMVVSAGTHSYVWLEPVASSFVVGRNMPVKFRVLGPDGSLVFDSSVRVDVVDASGAVVAGPYFYGDQPNRSVTWNGDYYHVNVDTRALAPDLYVLRVQFSSPTLSGEFTLATNGTAGSLRWSGLRQ